MKTTANDISDLLKTKSFDTLSDIEKTLVLKELGNKDNYDALREQLLEYSRMEDVVPPESMRTNVMNAFDRFHKKERQTFAFWRQDRRWFKQPITVALAAAAVLLIVFLALPVNNGNRSNNQLAEQKPAAKVERKSQEVHKDSVHKTAAKPEKPEESISKERKNLVAANQNSVKSIVDKDESESRAKGIDDDIETKEAPKAKAPVVMEIIEDAEIAESTDSFEAPKSADEVSNYLNFDSAQSLKKEENRSQERSDERLDVYSLSAVSKDAQREADKSENSVFTIQMPLSDHYISY